jgi:hypothetical protein
LAEPSVTAVGAPSRAPSTKYEIPCERPVQLDDRGRVHAARAAGQERVRRRLERGLELRRGDRGALDAADLQQSLAGVLDEVLADGLGLGQALLGRLRAAE